MNKVARALVVVVVVVVVVDVRKITAPVIVAHEHHHHSAIRRRLHSFQDRIDRGIDNNHYHALIPKLNYHAGIQNHFVNQNLPHDKLDHPNYLGTDIQTPVDALNNNRIHHVTCLDMKPNVEIFLQDNPVDLFMLTWMAALHNAGRSGAKGLGGLP